VPADLEILLDSGIQAKECLDTSASVCRQVVILLDAHGAGVSISGSVNSSFETRCKRRLLSERDGAAYRDHLPNAGIKRRNSTQALIVRCLPCPGLVDSRPELEGANFGEVLNDGTVARLGCAGGDR
jgi:hypothetical protein